MKKGIGISARRILVFSLCCLVSAQILAHQGNPPKLLKQSFEAKRAADTLTVDAIDAEAALQRDFAKTDRLHGTGPVRYALPFAVQATTASHGSWSNHADGKVWRLRVNSPGATDLNFGFGRFNLPRGASLHIYNPSNGYYQGPYTTDQQYEHGQLWTPVIPGSTGIIELYVPADASHPPELELIQVGRGYRNLFETGLARAMKRGSCHVDVACPAGDAWSDQIRSVAVYGTNGSTFCTGTLVNNIAQDGKPYILTAKHCGLTPGNAPTVVAYWNFESPTCGQNGGGTLSDNTSGATWRASSIENDMTLIELNSIPRPAYDVFYAGWDARSSTTPQGSVGIHHPRTGEKAISINDDPLTTMNNCIATGGLNTHWRVDNWEIGSTEPGSSGSGLFDADSQLLVGYLSGGLSSCSVRSFDCYGKISVGWDSGLKRWLDPDNTDTRYVEGMEPVSNGVTELQNNETVNDLEGDQGDWQLFMIQIPAGASNLSIVMSVVTGEADLYTRYSRLPTLVDFDCRPNLDSGQTETCLLTRPDTGEYYIGIHGQSSFSGGTISVTYENDDELCFPVGKAVICL